MKIVLDVPGQRLKLEEAEARFPPQLGCLPFVLAVLAGPLVFFATASQRDMELTTRVMISRFIGLFGIVIGGLAIAMIVSALPRRVALDWGARAITLAGLTSRKEIPFVDVSALELRCLRVYHSSKSSSYHSYHCEVRAHYADPTTGQTKTEVLVETNRFREDPDTPYQQALPLVTDLAGALHVERRVTDYA